MTATAIDTDLLDDTIQDLIQLYREEPTEERLFRLQDWLHVYQQQTGKVHPVEDLVN